MFGERTTIETFGPAYATTCERCHKPVALHYSRRERRRVFLFVPVGARRTTHVLSCPTCFHDEVLTDDQGAQAEALTRSLAAYRRGDLPAGHYRQHATALQHQAGEARLPAPAV
ncbi:MAG: hypothetical protein U0W40_12525 [Acidimicrobiia bacterium]